MFSSQSVVAVAATVLLSASMATAVLTTVPSPTSLPAADAVEMGCYSSSLGLNYTYGYMYMTGSLCQKICLDINKPVSGTSASSDCYCGDTMPPSRYKESTTANCNAICGGYNVYCGGANTSDGGVYLTIYNDELKSSVSNLVDAVASASSSGSAAAKTSGAAKTSTVAPQVVITVGGQTVTTTPSATATNDSSSSTSSSGPNKAAVAAGVVVGLVAVAAIAGGLFLFMRNKKRRELEEEHKRQVAVNSFINGGKPGSSGSSGTNSYADVRIDPVLMAQRRMSDGSIMDNQDYSRRILKVTNA